MNSRWEPPSFDTPWVMITVWRRTTLWLTMMIFSINETVQYITRTSWWQTWRWIIVHATMLSLAFRCKTPETESIQRREVTKTYNVIQRKESIKIISFLPRWMSLLSTASSTSWGGSIKEKSSGRKWTASSKSVATTTTTLWTSFWVFFPEDMFISGVITRWRFEKEKLLHLVYVCIV